MPIMRGHPAFQWNAPQAGLYRLLVSFKSNAGFAQYFNFKVGASDHILKLVSMNTWDSLYSAPFYVNLKKGANTIVMSYLGQKKERESGFTTAGGDLWLNSISLQYVEKPVVRVEAVKYTAVDAR